MNIVIGNIVQAQVNIRPILKQQTNVEGLPGFEIKEHMSEKDAVTWQYGLNGAPHTMIVGLGEASKLSEEQIRTAAGCAGRSAGEHAAETVSVYFQSLESSFAGGLSEAAALQAWVEGWLLGTYSFDKYKSKKGPRHVKTLQLSGSADPELETAARQGQIRAEGTMVARDLSNEPPNELRPSTLANRVLERFAGTSVQVQIFQGEQLEEQQMNGIITVGKGSKHPPVMIEMRYCTDPSKPLVALIGKGITFDTGGISLKIGNRDLSNMRIDMGGAAAVIGAMDIIVKSKLQTNVVVLVASAENMPDGESMLPGEVIRYANGTTVQVKNTDAEGRLILADALLYAQKLGASQMIDIATLTGACAAALGVRLAGVFGNEDMPDILHSLGKRNGERSWPLPLEDEYEDLLKSQYADLANITNVPYAGAISAALFLRRFVDSSVRWAHLDIAGPMESDSTRGYTTAGPTGYGARLLADYVMLQ